LWAQIATAKTGCDKNGGYFKKKLTLLPNYGMVLD